MEASGGDPDKLALLYVQQWLHEHGYDEALQALERKCGLLYDDSKLERSSQLLQLVYRHMEELITESGQGDVSGDAATDAVEDEAMLRGGRGDFPQTTCASITDVHTSTVVCVRLIHGRNEVLTGAGDGQIRRITFSGDVLWTSPVGSGGVLCMDMHPAADCILSRGNSLSNGCATNGHGAVQGSSHDPVSPCHLLAAGSMDGSLSIVHLATGQLLAAHKCHTKYLVRCIWSGDGHHLITCSHDQTLQVHKLEIVPQGDSQPQVVITTIKTIQYTASVQDVAILIDGITLVVALRDTNFLRVLTLNDLDAPEQLVNMNAVGDTHVSFFARHLVPSPCSRFLLVATDTGRMLVLRTKGWRLCRYVLYSLPTEQFHQFCAAWSRDSHYVFAGAAGGQVWVYHVGSGKVVAKLKVHKVNVRDLDYDPDRNILATCSFDKTVQILKHVEGGTTA